MSSQPDLTDQSIVDFLRRRPDAAMADLVEFAGVTATAVRQRLSRLMDQGLVDRESEAPEGRGRPTHRYRLTEAGQRTAGDNYDQLVVAMWQEIRAIDDPEVRRGLLQRIAVRLADAFRDQVTGESLQQRMDSLVGLMTGRNIPFEVTQDESGPVLTALACPYPEIAALDRGVCSMEKMLFSELLGQSFQLNGCRLDGENCCNFVASGELSAVE